MSATGRGTKRARGDFYETPEWLTRAILPHLPENGLDCLATNGVAQILEPAAGAGAISRVLKEYWWQADIYATDIDPRGEDIEKIDFLRYRGTWGRGYSLPGFDLIITNPPYLHAEAFVRRALDLVVPGGIVAMLLRINFLGGQKRAAWLRANPPNVYVTPRRPSFRKTRRWDKKAKKWRYSSTDASEYAWFVWGQGEPRIHILHTEKDDRSQPVGKLSMSKKERTDPEILQLSR